MTSPLPTTPPGKKRKTLKWLFPAAFLLLVALLLMRSCGLGGWAASGTVMDAKTQTPIADAIVVGRWQGSLFAFAESQTVCIHVQTTTTDSKGRYRFWPWMQASTPGLLTSREVYVTAHKPGYRWADKHEKGAQYLQPFTGTREERLGYLRRVYSGTGCHNAGESEDNLSLLLKALYDEAKGIAKTDADKKIVEDLLTALETVTLGYEQAEKRHLQRIRSRQ